MPKFEVHIPAQESTGFNFTFRVDAETWMAALKLGMLKLGEQGVSGQNVLVDIQDDNSLHVTESTTGRVFQIRELTDQEAKTARPKTRPPPPPKRRDTPVDPAFAEPGASNPNSPAAGAKTLVEIPALSESLRPDAMMSTPAIGLEPSNMPGMTAMETSEAERLGPIAEARLKEAARAAAKSATASKRPSSKINIEGVVELERPVKPVSAAIGRPREKAQGPDVIEATLAEVFERVQEVYSKSVSDALYFLLDLALEKIPCDSGSIFQADAGSGDLTFSAVRGPKADELLEAKLVVPAGNGVVGFCAMEGVSVALSDVQKDPRFYAAVSARVNYETKSVLCSPMMTHGRAFGAMQLINRKGSPQWGVHELGLLAYIAHQGALFLNAQS